MVESSAWRDASLTPTFMTIPCIAYTPLLLVLYYTTWATVYFAMGTIAVYGLLAWLGYPLKVLLAKVSHFIRGHVVYARPWWWRRRFFDR